ncbi:MAG: hypothetical protein U5P10_17530 [Spirochaetia bacterium]|nr:hypothetical protein [Spirochaetia bacterium]
MSDQSFSGDIDPEVAELMGIDEEDNEETPDFTDLFGEAKADKLPPSAQEIDLNKSSFPKIEKFFKDTPNPLFSSTDYYKQALSGEGEPAQRVHSLLAKFLNVQDPKERSLYRNKLISAYWNLAASIASKIHTKLPAPKRYMLRYGYLLPTAVSKEQRDMLARIIDENYTGEPIHYIDEWLYKVAMGQIGQSMQDEVRVSQKDRGGRIQMQAEKARGNRDVQIGQIKSKMTELESAEELLKSKAAGLASHQPMDEYYGLKSPYTPEQRSALSEINQMVRRISTIDKELGYLFRQLEEADQTLEKLENKADDLGESIQQVDAKAIEQEFNSVRQMVKMSVGRQGNHIPFLMKQYFRALDFELGTRENIIKQLADIERIDPGLFQRSFKQQVNRIVPHIILIPCYGERGICWEPFEKYNRATSRGRVAIPMYPKDLRSAIIIAMADLRWQVAKEKAQHYWMEEGLTGNYYMWFESQKLRGDVKEYFIQDYLLWINKESEGTQKLNREVRGIFWRYMPFPQELKDSLKNRGFVYNELYKKDKNRAISDGY